jgi:hemerythrin-like domain-containing protein
MDAIRLLTEDHKQVKALFHDYEKLSDNAHKRRQQVVERVFHELEVHTKIEEEFFYPAMRAKADDEGQDMVSEACEEHHVVDVLMSEMKQLEPDNPEYAAKFSVLMENVEHHADEEEKELFPLAKKLLRDELDDMGQQMERRKEQLMATMR